MVVLSLSLSNTPTSLTPQYHMLFSHAYASAAAATAAVFANLYFHGPLPCACRRAGSILPHSMREL